MDVRQDVIEEAKKELSDYNLEWKEPRLICARSLSSLNLQRKFDYIWAFQVLIHMTDAVLHNALGFVVRHLANHGCFYATVNISNQSDALWRQGFPVVFRPLDFYEKACLSYGLRCEDLGLSTNFSHHCFSGEKQKKARPHLVNHMIKIYKQGQAMKTESN